MTDTNQLPTPDAPLKTIGQTVWIDGDALIIKYGIMYYGFLGQKRIPIQNIKTVSWKDPGDILAGFLEISILGEAPPHPSASHNVQHQNRFIYPRENLEKWRGLKSWIEARIGPENTSPSISIADELLKFGELLKAGLITQSEFEIGKQKLLS